MAKKKAQKKSSKKTAKKAVSLAQEASRSFRGGRLRESKVAEVKALVSGMPSAARKSILNYIRALDDEQDAIDSYYDKLERISRVYDGPIPGAVTQPVREAQANAAARLERFLRLSAGKTRKARKRS